jgi:hypothetical protein
MHEVGEDAEFVAGELDGGAIHGDARGAGVEGEGAAADFDVREAGGAANQGAEAGQEFLDAEGFREVVVGAAVDALDLLVPTAARGEDENREEEAGVAPAAEERQAVDFRKAEVEDDGIVRFGVGKEVGAFPVGGGIHGVAGRFERCSQLPRQRLLVFDHQNPHSTPSFLYRGQAERRLNGAFRPDSGGLGYAGHL